MPLVILILSTSLVLIVVISLTIIIVIQRSKGPEVIVTPAMPITTDDLVASITGESPDGEDIEGSDINYEYNWLKDSIPQDELTTDTVPASETAKGQVWECEVTFSGSEKSFSVGSKQITIRNSPPTATEISISPAIPNSSDNLVCNIDTPSFDADHDTVTYSYAWYKDDVLQRKLTSDTVASLNTGDGQVWRCEVTASDGTDNSKTASYEVTVNDYIRGLYVWWHSYRIFQDEAEEQRFLDICVANNINQVYMSIGADCLAKLTSNPEWFTRVNGHLQELGIDSHAMLPSVGIAEMSNPEIFRPYVEGILRFNSNNPDYRFNGIHLDWEPGVAKTDIEHAQYLDACLTAVTAMKNDFSYGSETIASQGLALSFDVDARWGTEPECIPSFTKIVGEFDFITIMAYRNSSATVIDLAEDECRIAEAEGVPFIISQEIAEGDSFICGPGGEAPVSWYVKGKDALEGCFADLKTHYVDNYGSQFLGVAIHHYSTLSYWHTLDTQNPVTWPSGSFDVGDNVTITPRLRTSDTANYRLLGVELLLRDEEGNTWRFTKIEVMYQMVTAEPVFNWTVPGGALGGSYDAKVTVYDLDLNNEGDYSILWYDNIRELYSTNSACEAAIEKVDLDQLAYMTKWTGDLGTAPLTGKRDPILELQTTGWVEDVFKVTKPSGDTTAPHISGVSASDIGAISVHINWTTDEPATSKVSYGLSGRSVDMSTDLDARLVTTHQVTITGLYPSTSYDFEVKSRDISDNLSVSKKYSFSTPAAILSLSFDEPPTPANGATVTANSVQISATTASTYDVTSSFIDWNNSLVGYWDFNEGSGTRAVNNSTYGLVNDGKITGATWTTEGKFGSALEFDGNGDYVNCGNNISLNSSDEITIEAWIYAHDLNGERAIVSRGYTGNWAFYVRNSKLCLLHRGSGITFKDANTVLQTNRWYHVVAVYTNSNRTVTFYVNGSADGGGTYSSAMDTSAWADTVNTYIGTYGEADSYYFDGLIDEVRVWNRALSLEEIQASYNSSLYKLSHKFTGLVDGKTYKYYSYITDITGSFIKTVAREVTINLP